MKTHEKAKLAGLKNLAELSNMTKVTTEAFRSWDKNRQELFVMVLYAAKAKKENRESWVNFEKLLGAMEKGETNG